MKTITAFSGSLPSLASFWGICLLLFCLSACQDSSPLLPAHELAGSYELADLTLVNAESGTHQRLASLPHLGQQLELGANGRFQMATSSGHWQQSGAYLHLEGEAGMELALRLVSAEDGRLELEQVFEGREGFSGGVIFYELLSR